MTVHEGIHHGLRAVQGLTRDPRYLLPLPMKEWLPEDHPALFVVDAVKEMNLDAFDEGDSEDGKGNVP